MDDAGRCRGGDGRGPAGTCPEDGHRGARNRYRSLRSAQIDSTLGRRGHLHDGRHAGEPRLRHEDPEAGPCDQLVGLSRWPHLYLQAARRRHLLQRQEDDRQGRGRHLRALARSRDQGAGEVAHGRGRQDHRPRRRHGRIQAQEAVLRTALSDDAVLPHGPECRPGQTARRGLRREGLRRHRPLLLRKLDAPRFDCVDQAQGLQVGPADLRLHRSASRQGDLEGRARGEHARHRPAGRPGRRQPVRSVLVDQGAAGQQEPLGHQGRELLLDLLHRLQGRQGTGERRSRAQGDEPRRRPEGDPPTPSRSASPTRPRRC